MFARMVRGLRQTKTSVPRVRLEPSAHKVLNALLVQRALSPHKDLLRANPVLLVRSRRRVPWNAHHVVMVMRQLKVSVSHVLLVLSVLGVLPVLLATLVFLQVPQVTGVLFVRRILFRVRHLFDAKSVQLGSG